MTERLSIHQPLLVEDPSPKSVDERRVYDLLVAQENIARIVDQLADKPWLDGVLIEAETLTAGETKNIEHKLGRTIRGYIIAKQDAAGVIFNDTSTTVDATKFIALQAVEDVVFDIIVY